MTPITHHLSPTGELGPIYQSAYRYQRPVILMVAIGFLGVFFPAFVRFSWEIGTQWKQANALLVLIVPTLIFGVFAFSGGLFLFYYLTDRSVALVVNRSGVLYGNRVVPWHEIGSLKGRKLRGTSGFLLVLRRRKLFSRALPLITNDGLTINELQWLMKRLQDDVAPSYEHLQFVSEEKPPVGYA